MWDQPLKLQSIYSYSPTGRPDDDVWNGVSVDVGHVQGVSEAGGDAAALAMPSSRHLDEYIYFDTPSKSPFPNELVFHALA